MTYPGGKAGAGVYQTIINLMPWHAVYIEPFLGGGAVMRLKRPSLVNIGMDLDDAAVKGFKLLSSPLLAGSAETVTSGDARSPIAKTGGGRRIPSPVPVVSDPASPKLPVSADLSKSGDGRSPSDAETSGRPCFEIWQRDGIDFLKSYSFTGRELVYCDPPYLLSTRSGGKLYKFEMTEAQHRDLLDVIRRIPCAVMISGYWSELYARELAAWNAKTFQSMTRAGKPATEWLWFNFAPPTVLHDYQYLGADFRERERIRRKKLRWIERLRQMPTMERRALLSAIAEVVV